MGGAWEVRAFYRVAAGADAGAVVLAAKARVCAQLGIDADVLASQADDGASDYFPVSNALAAKRVHGRTTGLEIKWAVERGARAGAGRASGGGPQYIAKMVNVSVPFSARDLNKCPGLATVSADLFAPGNAIAVTKLRWKSPGLRAAVEGGGAGKEGLVEVEVGLCTTAVADAEAGARGDGQQLQQKSYVTVCLEAEEAPDVLESAFAGVAGVVSGTDGLLPGETLSYAQFVLKLRDDIMY